MIVFAKLFDLPTHQVLFYKDFEQAGSALEGLHTTYRIVALVGYESPPQLTYKYDSAANRDQVFEQLDQGFAESALSVVLEAFKPQLDNAHDD